MKHPLMQDPIRVSRSDRRKYVIGVWLIFAISVLTLVFTVFFDWSTMSFMFLD